MTCAICARERAVATPSGMMGQQVAKVLQNSASELEESGYGSWQHVLSLSAVSSPRFHVVPAQHPLTFHPRGIHQPV